MEICDLLGAEEKRVFFTTDHRLHPAVLYAGIHRAAKYHRAKRYRNHCSLHVVLAGRARSELGDLVVDMAPGDLYCCLPYETKDLASASDDCVWAFIGIHDPELPAALVAHGLGRSGPLLQGSPTTDFHTPTLELLAELAQPGLRSAVECRARLELLLNRMIRHHGRPAEVGADQIAHEAVAQARKLITQQAGEISGVAELARSVGLERSYFSRLFHRQTGETVRAALQRARLEQAERLLRDQRLSIAAVADLCGFEDYGTFHRFFKREHGCSPSDWCRTTATRR